MSEAMPKASEPRDKAGDSTPASPPRDLLQALEAGEMELGEALRRRREQLDMSVKDAALRLDVSSAHIEAVERDDYGHFAAPIYARSFLRRYARLLDWPAEAVLAAYERQAHPEPPPLKRVSLREQVTPRHASVRWTTILLIVVLAALVAVWWWSMTQTPSPVSMEEAPPADAFTLPVPQQP